MDSNSGLGCATAASMAAVANSHAIGTMGPGAAVEAVAAAASSGLLPAERELRAARKRLQQAEEQLAKAARYRANDYAVEESDLRRSLILNTSERQFRQEAAFAWGLSAVIGLLSGLAGFLFNQGIYLLNKAKFQATLRAIQPGGGFARPYATYLAFTLLYSAAAAVLGSYVSPQAAGSGIPEIRCYLNGIHVRGLLTIRTFFAKAFGLLFSIASGLVVGKEGPFTHVGAILGGGVAGLGSTSLTRATRGKWRAALHTRFGRYFRSAISHRDYVAAGAAAGVSSAFGAPIGGILFSVEQGASFYNFNMLCHAFLAAGVALFVNLLLSSALWDGSSLNYVAFTAPEQFVLIGEIPARSRFWYYAWELPIFALMGVGGGLAGAAMVAVNNRIAALRKRYIPATQPARRVLEVVLLAALTATAWLLACYCSPCAPVPAAAVAAFNGSTAGDGLRNPVVLYGGLFPQLWCPDGEYSQFGMLFFLPYTTAISLLFQYQLPDGTSFIFSPAALATLACLGWFFTTVTFGVGTVTGLFVPSLLVGAAGGRLVGRAVRAAALAAGFAVEGLPAPDSVSAAAAAAASSSAAARAVHVCLSAYAVIGAGSVLGGVTRMLLCNTVLVMETAGATDLVVPLIVATFVAKMVADALAPRGIFDEAIRRAGYPYLEPEPPDLTGTQLQQALCAGDVCSRRLVTLPAVVRVGELVAALRSHPNFSTFPLVEVPDAAPSVPSAAAAPAEEAAVRDPAYVCTNGADAIGTAADADGGSGVAPPTSPRRPSYSTLSRTTYQSAFACPMAAAAAAAAAPLGTWYTAAGAASLQLLSKRSTAEGVAAAAAIPSGGLKRAAQTGRPSLSGSASWRKEAGMAQAAEMETSAERGCEGGNVRQAAVLGGGGLSWAVGDDSGCTGTANVHGGVNGDTQSGSRTRAPEGLSVQPDGGKHGNDDGAVNAAVGRDSIDAAAAAAFSRTGGDCGDGDERLQNGGGGGGNTASSDGGSSPGVIVGVISRAVLLKLIGMRLQMDTNSGASSLSTTTSFASSTAGAAPSAAAAPTYRKLPRRRLRLPFPSLSPNSRNTTVPATVAVSMEASAAAAANASTTAAAAANVDGTAAAADGAAAPSPREPTAWLGRRRAVMSRRRAARLLDAVDPHPAKAPDSPSGEEELFGRLQAADLEASLDLRHYMQRVPYVVPSTASLARTYRLFRGLGLHHLLVTEPHIPIIGLLTRSDIGPDNAYRVAYRLAEREQQLLQAALIQQTQDVLYGTTGCVSSGNGRAGGGEENQMPYGTRAEPCEAVLQDRGGEREEQQQPQQQQQQLLLHTNTAGLLPAYGNGTNDDAIGSSGADERPPLPADGPACARHPLQRRNGSSSSSSQRRGPAGKHLTARQPAGGSLGSNDVPLPLHPDTVQGHPEEREDADMAVGSGRDAAASPKSTAGAETGCRRRHTGVWRASSGGGGDGSPLPSAQPPPLQTLAAAMPYSSLLYGTGSGGVGGDVPRKTSVDVVVLRSLSPSPAAATAVTSRERLARCTFPSAVQLFPCARQRAAEAEKATSDLTQIRGDVEAPANIPSHSVVHSRDHHQQQQQVPLTEMGQMLQVRRAVSAAAAAVPWALTVPPPAEALVAATFLGSTPPPPPSPTAAAAALDVVLPTAPPPLSQSLPPTGSAAGHLPSPVQPGE